MQPEISLPRRDPAVPRWEQLLSEHGLLEQLNDSFPTDQKVSTETTSSKLAAIQQGLGCLTGIGQVVELRVLGINGKKRTDSGYFDNVRS